MNKIYNQRADESAEDWKYRLLLEKANNEDIDLTWEEIVDKLRLPYSPAYAEEYSTAIKDYRDYIKSTRKSPGLSDEELDVISKAEMKIYEMKAEKVKLQDHRRELNKLIRESARLENIREDISDAIHDSISSLRNTDLKKYYQKNEKAKGDNEGVLLLSDWHIGMVADNMINTYNEAIMKERVSDLLDKTIEYGRFHNIKTLNIFFLGDIVNGLIHITTRINNQKNVIRQTMVAAEVISKFVAKLSGEFPEIKLYFSRGNHERISANPKESIEDESLFDVIPWYVKTRVEDIPNIKIIENDLDSEIISTEICDQQIFAVHGHKDQVTNVVENLALMTKTTPDYVFMGHYHSGLEKDIHGATIIVNGSLCGVDDFAMKIRKTSKPMQKFMVFNKAGRLCTYDVTL